MGTEILKSFGTLQSELEQARSSLKGVDENIKRLIGRDPSEIIPRPGIKRGPPTEENRASNKRVVTTSGRAPRNVENDEPPAKRRNGNISVFKRLSERPSNYEEEALQPQKQMISKVIVTPREVPSRQEALAAQSTDEKSKARNRRMFGALLGTLQKFQQEEIKLKKKEEKRAQVEKKIEEHEIKEKAEIKKERQELFLNRKKKQAEIKMIELKMIRMKEYAIWEEQQKPTMNFIRTKAKPHIFYLPRKLNDASKAMLETCRGDVEKSLDEKRQEVFDELQHIEDRMKKNFEGKRATFEEPMKELTENKEVEHDVADEDIKMEEASENGELPATIEPKDTPLEAESESTVEKVEESVQESEVASVEEAKEEESAQNVGASGDNLVTEEREAVEGE